jgi:hypothetical protein
MFDAPRTMHDGWLRSQHFLHASCASRRRRGCTRIDARVGRAQACVACRGGVRTRQRSSGQSRAGCQVVGVRIYSIIDSVASSVLPGPRKSVQRMAGASARVLQRGQRAEERHLVAERADVQRCRDGTARHSLHSARRVGHSRQVRHGEARRQRSHDSIDLRERKRVDASATMHAAVQHARSKQASIRACDSGGRMPRRKASTRCSSLCGAPAAGAAAGGSTAHGGRGVGAAASGWRRSSRVLRAGAGAASASMSLQPAAAASPPLSSSSSS